MAFPHPSLLASIEDLLAEMQWQDGMILVTDAKRATFVSFSQVDPVLRRLRAKPKGMEVAEKLCMALLDCHGKAASKPAAQEDIFLYRGMGSSYVCNARAAKVEFPKAVGIAAATYVQVLNGRHGGKVQSVGQQKLTNAQLLAGAEFQIITGALQYCPDEVPADVKAKVEEAVKKQNAKAGQ